jgi:hypothetical protein
MVSRTSKTKTEIIKESTGKVEKKIQGDQKDHMIKDQNRSTCKKIPRDHPGRSWDRPDHKL